MSNKSRAFAALLASLALAGVGCGGTAGADAGPVPGRDGGPDASFPAVGTVGLEWTALLDMNPWVVALGPLGEGVLLFGREMVALSADGMELARHDLGPERRPNFGDSAHGDIRLFDWDDQRIPTKLKP